MKQLRIAAILLMLVSLASLSSLMAQPTVPVEIPVTMNDGVATSNTIFFGVFPGANFCINAADVFPGSPTHIEAFLPAEPPTLEVRFKNPKAGPDGGCYQLGSYYTYNNLADWSQADSFIVSFVSEAPTAWSFTVGAIPSQIESLTLQEIGGRPDIFDLKVTPTVIIDPGLALGVSKVKIRMRYMPEPPCLSIDPSPLPFGDVTPGSFFDLNVTATNALASTVQINSLSSSNGVFALISPPAFPVVLTPGNGQLFTVRFTPTAIGTQAGTLTFNTDCSSNPTVAMSGRGIGAEFSASPLDFGTHNAGTSSTLSLAVSNTGNLDLILNAPPTVTDPAYTVVPNPPAGFPMTIIAGGSHNFDVTFSSMIAGPHPDNITFTHNGIPNPTLVAVAGTIISNAVLFTADARTQLEDVLSYQDNLQLVYGGPGPLKAMQLRLVVKGNGTSGLYLQGVNKGVDFPPGFNLATHIHYAATPPNGDGTMDDTMSIVLYGNGSSIIPQGSTLNDFLKFRYGVGHVTPNGTQVVHVELLSVFASLPNGDPVTVAADAPQIITIDPRGINGYMYGDVNHDHSVDIVDLLLMVDYILGRNPAPFDMTLADIAPWSSSSHTPSPDGVVNVQDLALLQQIILTGQYPDGMPSYRPSGGSGIVQSLAKGGSGNGVSTLTPGKDVKLTFYVTNQGINVRLESIVKVKGIQLQFGHVPSVPSTMNVTTLLGDGPFFAENDLLRVLMYNQEARVVEPGDVIVGRMPFAMSNPEAVTVDRVIVVDEQNVRVQDLEIEIINGEAPELPVEYMLFQNYPNPFNPSTSVSFSVPQLTDVKVAIYNMLGQEVQTLFNQKMDRGTKVVVWNGFDRNGVAAASGPYIVRMIAGDFVASRKMMFIK